MHERLDRIESRLDRIESRLDRIESRLDGRLDRIEAKLSKAIALSNLTLDKERSIMATQAELVTKLNAVNDNLKKIGGESGTLIAKIDELKAQLANAPVSPELQAAVDAVAAQAKVVDDLVPDAP